MSLGQYKYLSKRNLKINHTTILVISLLFENCYFFLLETFNITYKN